MDHELFIFGSGLVVASLVGFVPRVGLGRALGLHFSSFFKSTSPVSVRKNDILLLKTQLSTIGKGDYIIISGGIGNGKTCLIDTALNREFSVVKTEIDSGADKNSIIHNVLKEITKIRFSSFYDLTGNARRVLFFHNLFFNSPIAVINVPERSKNENYASLPAAVRSLSNLGIRVIVDGPPNSLPPELFTTKRQWVITIEEMTRDEIESVPEFSQMIDFLKQNRIDDAVWQVLGGNPQKYKQLRSVFTLSTSPEEIILKIKEFLISELGDAYVESTIKSNKNTKEIINIFRERNVLKISIDDLDALGYQLDEPNEVFRMVKRKVDDVNIEPIVPAVGLIIGSKITGLSQIRPFVDALFFNNSWMSS